MARLAWLARDGLVRLALLGEPTKLYRMVALYSTELQDVSDEMIPAG